VSSGGPFSGPTPRWFTLQAHRPFLADLARGLLQALSSEALAEAVVLLPSRRAARSLAEAFVEVAEGRALLLPQVRALGDLEEGEPPFEPGDVALDLPAAIGPWRRRFELARIVAERQELLGRVMDGAAALELADALGALIDSLEIEEVPEAGRGERLERLVEGDLAAHWQVSARFLRAALDAWPERLGELGLIDPSARRVRLLRALAGRWAARPPAGPMLAAGSTGTAPANADLLKLIAGLPQGAVVLPGLDLELAEDAWAEVGEQHPQGAMKRLLQRAGIDRGQVRPWPAGVSAAEGRWRRRIVNEALRPPEATADWTRQILRLRQEGAEAGVDPIAEGLDGLTLVSARAEEDAAAAAALLMREALETPGKTCALITPDQALARRVSARLARWDIEADSSAGRPLAELPSGVLIGLVAGAAVDVGDPVALLAVLKHPLVRLGLEPRALERARRALERYGLRGARLSGDDWIERRLAAHGRPREREAEVPRRRLDDLAEAGRLLQRLRAALALAQSPYTGGTAAPSEAARGLAEALEALAAGPAGGVGGLWAGPGGEAAAALLEALINDSSGLPEAPPAGFAALLSRLTEGETVRAVRAAHPRLRILGAIESRLVSADRLILAGLEDGVWPQGAPVDPFLSRPMREAFGLPPPERRIGLSAHDFAQAASAGEVYLIHSQRREGAPAVESRWLWRLRTLARGAGVELPGRSELADWASALDQPGPFRPAARPRPAPPVEVRPTELSVTRVETWVRDPYAIYARYVLGMRPLERPGEPVEARARGEAVHRALQRFAEQHPEALPSDSVERLERLLVEALAEAGMGGPAMARERALASQAARWLAGFEAARRPGARLLVEQTGAASFDGPGGRFTVTARADRIELRDGIADVLDFKTGSPPSRRQVESDFAPQLTLTAAILARGGFDGAGPVQPGELMYVQVTGRTRQKEARAVAAPPQSAEWAERAFRGLIRRVARFQSPDVEYVSWAAPQYMHERGGDYDHLARVWEWHVIGEGEEGGE
jgi:ATP-dependent helicase/nuclease subunit B